MAVCTRGSWVPGRWYLSWVRCVPVTQYYTVSLFLALLFIFFSLVWQWDTVLTTGLNQSNCICIYAALFFIMVFSFFFNVKTISMNLPQDTSQSVATRLKGLVRIANGASPFLKKRQVLADGRLRLKPSTQFNVLPKFLKKSEEKKLMPLVLKSLRRGEGGGSQWGRFDDLCKQAQIKIIWCF